MLTLTGVERLGGVSEAVPAATGHISLNGGVNPNCIKGIPSIAIHGNLRPAPISRAAPIAERIAKDLASEPDLRVGSVTTPLTQANRRKAAGGTTPTRTKTTELRRTCPTCGDTPTRTGIYCLPCAEGSKLDRIPELSDLATEHLATARLNGNDPAHGGEAAAKRGETNRRRQAEIREWEQSNERPSPDVFEREILPNLEAVTAGQMARVTGLSHPYCSMIERGGYVPHPKHWDAIRGLQPTSDS